VADHAIERVAFAEGEERVSFQPARQLQARLPEPVYDEVEEDVAEDEPDEMEEESVVSADDRPGASPRPEAESDRDARGGRRRRRRRGGRGRDEGEDAAENGQADAAQADAAGRGPRADEPADDSAEGDASRRRRRAVAAAGVRVRTIARATPTSGSVRSRMRRQARTPGRRRTSPPRSRRRLNPWTAKLRPTRSTPM
jgi:ribonuclease E